MATIKAFIRTTDPGSARVRFRLTDGRNVQLSYTSDILVNPAWWDNALEGIRRRSNCPPAVSSDIHAAVASVKQRIAELYQTYGNALTSQSLTQLLNGNTPVPSRKTIHDLFAEFAAGRKPDVVVGHILERYETYLRYILARSNYSIEVSKFSADDITQLERYIKEEYKLATNLPILYNKKIAPRSANTIAAKMKVIRRFFNWLEKNNLISNNPFDYISMPQERYTTPYYLTLQERDKITHMPLPERLARQRDIFVFQCHIGCRVSDLMKLTPANVCGDFIEYIPQKTSKMSAKIVRVPLSSTAREIIERYAGGSYLLPCSNMQQYNEDIKEIVRMAGILRKVTVNRPGGGGTIMRPLYEVASSHMARRTFIGNLYKKVKDPNLIASMSGHSENSKAFARYREIDDEIKRGLIDLIE